jgi:hypothetical protein
MSTWYIPMNSKSRSRQNLTCLLLSEYFTLYWFKWQAYNSFYAKHDYFNFTSIQESSTFLFLCTIMSLLTAYCLHIPQFIWFAWACIAYENFFFQNKTNCWQKGDVASFIKKVVKSLHFAGSTVTKMPFSVITNYHLPISWMTYFITCVSLSFPYCPWQR